MGGGVSTGGAGYERGHLTNETASSFQNIKRYNIRGKNILGRLGKFKKIVKEIS